MRLILLPGLDGTGVLFGPLLRALPARVEATVVSYPPDPSLGYAELQAYVTADVPDAAPYVLVAESFSGPIAVAHAATRPPNLRGVVLCATFVRNPLPAFLPWLRLLAVPAVFRVPAPRSVLRAFLVGQDCPPEVLDLVISVHRGVSPSLMAHRLRHALGVNVAESLSLIAVPVLYLAGASDRLVGRRGLAQFEGRARELTVVELDGPHLLLQTRPIAAAREIVAFVDGACRRPVGD